MLRKCSIASITLLIAIVIIVPNGQAQFLHHPPYQDQHFNLDSTPRSSTGSYGDEIGTSSPGCIGCSSTDGTAMQTDGSETGGAARSGNGLCPPRHNATLRLWVPEEMSVEINGQATKHQMLAGIHRGSRIFSLEGLESDQVSPCDIVVYSYDEFGCPHCFRHSLAVQAGREYRVGFPTGFEPIETPAKLLPEMMMMGEEMYSDDMMTDQSYVESPEPVPAPAPVADEAND